MKTPIGYLSFRLVIYSFVFGEEIELRTYRNKLLYFHGEMVSRFNYECLEFTPAKEYIRYKNERFLNNAELLTVDTIKLYEILALCLDWPTYDYYAISYSSGWELFISVNDKSRFIDSSYPDSEKYNLFRMELNQLIQRPL
ncbi:hypothetical protein GCM10028807_34560 [Spirosoma daeguense]